MARQELGDGCVYFCATLPTSAHSSLLQDGVVFYVMIQRALAIGAAVQGDVRQVTAGSDAASELASWQPLSEPPDGVLSTSRSLLAGAFQRDDKLIALNRPASEDRVERLSDTAVEKLFLGLPFRHVRERVGSATSLAREVWRAFVLLMALALMVEAWLCLPERKGAAANE